jgi:hypothetical protein
MPIIISFVSTSQLQPQRSFGSQNQTMVDLGILHFPITQQVQHQQCPIGNSKTLMFQ